MLKKIFSASQTSILSAAFVIAAMVATSRILGLIKNRMLAARFSPEELDPFWAAFRIPDFLFEVLIAGAISVAFIPIFTRYVSNHKKDEAHLVASSVMNASVIMVCIFSVLYFITAPWIIPNIVPGFSQSEIATAVAISRLLIVFQVLPLVLGNFCIAILQSYRQFLIPALAPVAYNIGMIAGIVLLSDRYGLYGAVYGVILGAIFFLGIQLPALWHTSYRHVFRMRLSHPGVTSIGKLMLPRTLSVSVTQLDFTLDVFLASLVGAGSITVLTFARQLQVVPLMLFGMPIAQAALPTFSEYVSRGSINRFKDTLLTSMHQILFLIFPASALLVILKVPIVRLVYGADQFDWEATVLTARTLAAFGVSLFAQALIVILMRAFFALHDSKTPVVISIIAVIINSVLSVYFILGLKLPVWGLGLSASVSSLLHAALLLILLDRKVQSFDRIRLIVPFIKIGLATLIMAFPLYVLLKLLDQLVFDTTRTLELVLFTGTITCIGLATYIFFAWLLKIEEVGLFYRFAQKLTKLKYVFNQFFSVG